MGSFGSQSIIGNLEAPWSVLRISIAPPPAPSTQRGPWRPPQWTNAPPQTSLTVLTTSNGSDDGSSGTTDYFFDAVFKVLHQQQLVVTQHPVQTGAPIVDHAYLLPAKVVLSVGISEAMDSYDAEAYSNGPKSVSAYQTFLSVQASRKPLTLTTRLRTYTNMVIENIEVIDDHKTVASLRAVISLAQIIPAVINVSAEPLPETSQRDQTSQSTHDGSLQPLLPNDTLLNTHVVENATNIPGAGTWSSLATQITGPTP